MNASITAHSQPTFIQFQHTYTDLESVTADGPKVIHIYGVVKFANEPKKASRGTSHYMVISLHNAKLFEKEERFTVSVFATFLDDLPKCEAGDVIRMNFVKVETFRDSVNGKLMMAHKGTWVLFKAYNTTYQWDTSSRSHITFEVTEEKLIKELREWRDRTDPDDMDALSPTKISVLPPETTNSVSSDHAVNPEHGGKPDEDNSNKPTIKEVPANDVSMEPKSSALTTQHVFSMPSNVAYQSTCVGTTLDRIESRDAFLNLKCRLVACYKSDDFTIVELQDGTIPNKTFKTPSLHDLNVEKITELRLPAEYSVYLTAYGKHSTLMNCFKLGACYVIFGVHCKVNSDSTAELYLHEKHKKMAEPTTRQEREKIINRIVPELNQISSKTASDDYTGLKQSNPAESRGVKIEKTVKIIELHSPQHSTVSRNATRKRTRKRKRNQQTAPNLPAKGETLSGMMDRIGRCQFFFVMNAAGHCGLHSVTENKEIPPSKDAVVFTLDTRLLVPDLEFLSVSQICNLIHVRHSTGRQGAASCVLVQTTAHLLPVFSVIKQSQYGYDDNSTAVSIPHIHVSLRDPDNKQTVIPAHLSLNVLQDGMVFGRERSEQKETISKTLQSFIPVWDKVHKIDVIVKIFGRTIEICHTKIIPAKS